MLLVRITSIFAAPGWIRTTVSHQNSIAGEGGLVRGPLFSSTWIHVSPVNLSSFVSNQLVLVRQRSEVRPAAKRQGHKLNLVCRVAEFPTLIHPAGWLWSREPNFTGFLSRFSRLFAAIFGGHPLFIFCGRPMGRSSVRLWRIGATTVADYGILPQPKMYECPV